MFREWLLVPYLIIICSVKGVGLFVGRGILAVACPCRTYHVNVFHHLQESNHGTLDELDLMTMY